jgi:hypothetical protein
MRGLQEIIHEFEEGTGVRYIKIAAVLLAWAALTLLYDLRELRNFSAPEAMEVSQLARNIATGKGYTTDVVRPLSVYLVQSHQSSHSDRLKEGHPDLVNPPLYPLILAGWMRILPFEYAIQEGQQFGRYQPELLIAFLNQIFFVAAVLLLFKITRQLFDVNVAWFAAVMLVCSDLLWRFSVSGLPTMLLLVFFLGIVHSLVHLEQGCREEQPKTSKLILGSAITGALLGLGCLTQYSFGWLVIPVVLFLGFYTGPKRSALILTTLAMFTLLVTPWIVRNCLICGAPFGIPTYAFLQGTSYFMGTSLERSLKPNLDFLAYMELEPYLRKLITNTSEILQSELPRLGGSWLTAFFLVGLFMSFKNPTLTRLRLFLVMSLLVLMIAQAGGQTHLTKKNPEITSENLLIIIAPLVFMYGSGLLFVLLENINFAAVIWRRWVIRGTGVVLSLPLLITLLPPRSMPVSYPPYWPSLIQEVSGFFDEKETLMTDMPWAVAWYGRHQAVLLTLSNKKDFYELNDFHKPIKGLYLTQLTLDENFLSNWVKGENRSWGRFVMESIVGANIPTDFPLRSAWANILPDQILLADFERWKKRAK